MKIPFDIKLKPQIESGEYKVVTGDDRPVRIISWDKKIFGGRFEIVALVPTPQGDTETVQLYCPDGTLIASSWNEKFKLFLITPEPELNEWQTLISGCLQKYGLLDCGAADRIAKNCSAELLELAERQLLTNDQNNHIWSDGYNTGYDDGKRTGREEALKDLPRWRKWKNGACGNGQGIPLAIVKRGLNGYGFVDALGIQGEQYIMLSDLEKLPGFNEK